MRQFAEEATAPGGGQPFALDYRRVFSSPDGQSRPQRHNCVEKKAREYGLMSIEANKGAVRRFAEVIFDEKRFDRAGEVALPDYIDHGAMPGQPPGLDGAKQKWSMWGAACPDLRVSIEDFFAEGDQVAARWRATGTHTGTLLGIPASGKRFQFDGMSIFRIAEGKVAEQWEAWDRFDLLQQLGGVSSPAAAPAQAG